MNTDNVTNEKLPQPEMPDPIWKDRHGDNEYWDRLREILAEEDERAGVGGPVLSPEYYARIAAQLPTPYVGQLNEEEDEDWTLKPNE